MTIQWGVEYMAHVGQYTLSVSDCEEPNKWLAILAIFRCGEDNQLRSEYFPTAEEGKAAVEQWLAEVQAEEVAKAAQEAAKIAAQRRLRDAKLKARIEALLASADPSTFGDGPKTEFSREIVRLAGKSHVIPVLAACILDGDIRPIVAAEALHLIGRAPKPSTYALRRALLERGLIHPSPAVRYTAVLGLAHIGGCEATRFQQALSRETDEDVIRVLQKALALSLENPPMRLGGERG